MVFELSQTMRRHDLSPSRAEGARLTLLELLHQRPEAPTALVVVAGSAHVLMPFTDDNLALEPYVQALSPELMPSDGQAFASAAQLVSALAHDRASPPTVLVVSDGMPPLGVDAFVHLHEREQLSVVILSVGADDDSLVRLAGRTEAPRLELSFGSRDSARLRSAIAQGQAHNLAPGDARFWRDDGPWLALRLALLVLLWFRRGFALGPLWTSLMLLCGTGCSPALAGLWLSPDQQGRLYFERGDYQEAAARFDDPLWKGLAFYAAEKWELAAQSFVSLQSTEGLFLLGNAYAQGGKLASALDAYDRALRRSPTDRSVRKNRDAVQELLHSLQEDTDPDSTQKPETQHGDRSSKLSPDELAAPPRDQPTASATDAPAQAPVEERVWLARLTTDPSEFLRRKLALQAARAEGR